MSLYRRRIGIDGERIASEFLLGKSFKIVEKNFSCKLGEIDIIAEKEGRLHFIEVKTRTSLDKGQPYEAVNSRKLYHIKNTIDYYLLKNKINNSKLSIDVVTIVIDRNNNVESINLYENITL